MTDQPIDPVLLTDVLTDLCYRGIELSEAHAAHLQRRVRSAVGCAEDDDVLLRADGSIERVDHFVVATFDRSRDLKKQVAELEATIEIADAVDRNRAVRLAELEGWKESAMNVLAEWDKVYDALGRPGPLGASKAASALAVLPPPPEPGVTWCRTGDGPWVRAEPMDDAETAEQEAGTQWVAVVFGEDDARIPGTEDEPKLIGGRNRVRTRSTLPDTRGPDMSEQRCRYCGAKIALAAAGDGWVHTEPRMIGSRDEGYHPWGEGFAACEPDMQSTWATPDPAEQHRCRRMDR